MATRRPGERHCPRPGYLSTRHVPSARPGSPLLYPVNLVRDPGSVAPGTPLSLWVYPVNTGKARAR